MISYYAGGGSYIDVDSKELVGLGYDLMKNHLIAWIDETEYRLRKKYFFNDVNILIDSGAFTAFTTGRKIILEDYADFIKSFKQKWSKKVNSVNFFNLDVIGDAEKGWENQHKLEKLNVNTIPVIHQEGFKKQHLNKSLKEYDCFAFGGLVGKRRKKEIIPFLDYCFKLIFSYVKKGNKLPKVHLLGVADPKILYRYPIYSCDSTTLMSINKFGTSRFLKLNNLPKTGSGINKHKRNYKYFNKYNYNKKEDQKLLIKLVGYEIRQYKKQEKEITEFWKKRGIDFEI